MKTIPNKSLNIILILIIYVFISSCNLIVIDNKSYKNKNEIINVVKNNLTELNSFVAMLTDVYSNMEPIIIKQDTILKFNSETKHNNTLYKNVFNKFNISAIRINNSMMRNDKNRIVFETYKKYSATYCGFYYSQNDNQYYSIDNNNSIANGNWTIHFFQEKSGWYTEKICDNWYYYEEDWDQFNFINYIKDDLKKYERI